ncbi:hypothetical protein OCO53_25565 [Peribacillus frigoritolerans]|uniref:hypothetical protein n=1 Tax=Peribacillus frigoritolerans TaxID=450367 RepID=UPI0021D1B90A|nr:hypothetical protein [Peribacillus frigoritolerans]MCU6603812.1 hypothetical protein [Peribacillus frigoritolerans]
MKNFFKKSKYFMQMVMFFGLVTCPTFVLAAASPEKKVTNALDDITKFVMILVPSLGVLLFSYFGLKALSSQDAHKKSEQRSNMVDVFKYVVLIELAAPLINWVIGLVA